MVPTLWSPVDAAIAIVARREQHERDEATRRPPLGQRDRTNPERARRSALGLSGRQWRKLRKAERRERAS